MDELDRALAAAQERYEAALRAEVDEKLKTQDANAWFGHWANQVGMPTLAGLAERLLAAGHKVVIAPKLSPTAEIITDIIFTFEQQNGPGKCTIEFRRGQEKSVAVFYAVNGTQGAGGRVEPPDALTVDRFVQTYIIEALEGPRW
jgi:hypothetical protein